MIFFRYNKLAMHRKDLNFINNSKNCLNIIEDEEKSPKSKRKKIVFLLIIFLFIFSFLTVKAIRNNKIATLEYDPVTLEPKEPEGLLKKISYLIFNRNTKLEGAKKDRINVLLLGQGGLGHDGPYLTDTIMLLSYSPSKNEIALISIPRDLGVEIEGYGLAKINHANHVGEMKKTNSGAALATKTISETFNIEIPYYVRIDFKAFTEIINEVGGVRVDVTKSFTDYQYPANNFQYQTISFESGIQTMDGDTALKFARSRHGNNGEGSDFARALRQQKIILAMKEKILSFSTLTNPMKIKKIISALENNMVTNMNFEEILEFIKIAKNLDDLKIHNLVLDDGPNGFLKSTIAENGAFLLLAKTGNWDDVSNAIKNIFDTEANEIEKISESASEELINIEIIEEKEEILNLKTKSDLIIEIQNGTWQSGLAAQLRQKLLDNNFNVENIGNTDTQIKPISKSFIYQINDNLEKTSIEELENLINIKTGQNPLNTVLLPATNTDLLIIIGDDYLN